MVQRHDRSKDTSQTASDAATQTPSSHQARSPKKIPAKCVHCAMLSMAEVRSRHGPAGDHCYVSKVCRSRRSYARHHRSRNADRRQQHSDRVTGLEVNRAAAQPIAELMVYRPSGYATPIEHIAVTVRQGKTKLAVVPPIDCAGLVPQQIYACIEAILAVLQREYGMARFANVVQRAAESVSSASPPKKNRASHPREIAIALPGVTDCYAAVLMIYRQLETSAVMAIKVEVWKGTTPMAEIPWLDCRGLRSSQIHAYLHQVLALLKAHYKLRWFARLSEHSSKSCPLLLDQAQPAVDLDSKALSLDLEPLWQALSERLQQPQLTSAETLEIAAAGVTEIVAQFTQFAALAFEELAAVAERGVMLSDDAFDGYVRQSMAVDFDEFIEPLASLPRKSLERQQLLEGDSVVGTLDQVALLHVLDEQMSQEPGLTEAEIFDRTLAIAPDEDVSVWAEAIAAWMQQHRSSVSLMDLAEGVQMPLLKVWLGVLLGGEFVVEQRGQFYDVSSVWISMVSLITPFHELPHTDDRLVFKQPFNSASN